MYSDRRPVVTQKDIAKRCGVSVITVSYALRGNTRKVSVEKMRLIVDTARAMGYDPAQTYAARSLRYSKAPERVASHIVALFTSPSMLRDEYDIAQLRGIFEVLNQHNYAAITHTYERPAQIELPAVFRRGDVDGALICSTGQVPAIVARDLREKYHFGERPIVTLLDTVPNCSAVIADDVAGGYAAIAHLLDLGHRHILHSIPDGLIPMYDRRLQGMRQACHDRDLNPVQHLHFVPCNSGDPRAGCAAMLDLLRRQPQITAVFAANDRAAICLYQGLREAGFTVPQDYSLVGYDDVETLPGASGENLLTTVRVPLRDIGVAAVELFLKHCSAEIEQNKTEILPCELMLRKTTGPNW
jgi:LacI family transcriptional regulator